MHSNKPLHLIYIPGLGDSKVTAQRTAVSFWNFYGVSAELFQVGWAEGAWAPKLVQLLSRIDSAVAAGKQVGLVGASAGAGAAINAYAARKNDVVGAVLLAGKVNRPNTIGQNVRNHNPAFDTSANSATAALEMFTSDDRRHILSRFGVYDSTVPAIDSRIPGVCNQRVPTAGHIINIALQLTLGAPSFIRFLKRQAVKK